MNLPLVIAGLLTGVVLALFVPLLIVIGLFIVFFLIGLAPPMKFVRVPWVCALIGLFTTYGIVGALVANKIMTG